MKKLLTVIVPSYNMEAFLDRSCKSLLANDSLEVLIVNDGSKDRTGEIGHAWETKHPEIFRVIDKPNGNYGSCINRGVREATGSFVRVLDADDYYDTQELVAFLSYLELIDSQPVDAIVSDYDMVDAEGKVLRTITYDLPRDIDFGVEAVLPMAKTLAMHGITYRTSLIREMAYHQTEGVSYTDNQWIILPFARVKNLRYFPKTIYHYFIGREGQTMSVPVNARNVEMSSRVLEDIGRAYKALKPSMSPASKTYFDLYLVHLIGRVYSDFIYRVPLSDFRKSFKRYDSAIRTDLNDYYSVNRGAKINIMRHLAWFSPLQMAYMVLLRGAIKVRGMMH